MWTLCRRRFYECWRHSWMLGYHSAVYYFGVGIIEMVGLDTFLQQWKRPIMSFIALLTGSHCAQTGSCCKLRPCRAVMPMPAMLCCSAMHVCGLLLVMKHSPTIRSSPACFLPALLHCSLEG